MRKAYHGFAFAAFAFTTVAVADGQEAPPQVVVANEIIMGSLEVFHEISWDANPEGCDPSISAPLHTATHSGYAIDIHEVGSRAHHHRRGPPPLTTTGP